MQINQSPFNGMNSQQVKRPSSEVSFIKKVEQSELHANKVNATSYITPSMERAEQGKIRFDESAVDIMAKQGHLNAESLTKDDISRQNQHAVNSYQNVNNLAQRENVQQMLGVDLFA